MSVDHRIAERKRVDCINVTDLTCLDEYALVSKFGYIVDASISGFLIKVQREDLVDPELKSNLSLDSLVGQHVVMFLPQMNLDLDGRITRTQHSGKGHFEIAVEFSADVPEYWRECLIELLPQPGELDEDEEALFT